MTRTTWSRFFDEYEPVHALVAESSGELLGLTHFLYHRSTIQVNPTCYLQDLFTTESARGRGVGRALIAAVYQRARTAAKSSATPMFSPSSNRFYSMPLAAPSGNTIMASLTRSRSRCCRRVAASNAIPRARQSSACRFAASWELKR